MSIEALEKEIVELLKNGKMTTEEIENALEKKNINECSDKVVFALLRLKNKGKVTNEFNGKKNIWTLK